MKYGVYILLTAWNILNASVFNISEQCMDWFKNNPPPEWMLEQIKDDIEPFCKKGIYSQEIEQTMEKIPLLIRITIKDNEVSWDSAKDFSKDKRLLRSLDLIREASEYLKFPDVQFLMTVLDCYDYPTTLNDTVAPVFTICKQRDNHKAILWPEMLGYKPRMITKDRVMHAEKDIPWAKKKPTAYWRGRSTGTYLHPYDWDSIPRAPLVMFSEKHPDLVDAKFSGVHWADHATREWLRDHYVVGYTPPAKQVQFKYQIAVDGNSFPTSLIWQLATESTVIKNRTDYIEWYHRGLIEDIHYVAYDTDCRDLQKVIETLRGDDKRAHQIARNATEFATTYLTVEGAAYYLYLLLKEYASLQKDF